MELKVLSYNVRYGSEEDLTENSWRNRRLAMKTLLKLEDADLIATQEGLYQQIMEIEADLEQYSWCGEGREGGKIGEHMAIFYKKDRFTLLETGHYWLSETPYKKGSMSWGTNYPRMVTWVKLKETQLNKVFYLINTHLDHESEQARIESSKMILHKSHQLEDQIPLILTGDFNTARNSNVHQILTRDCFFEDPWDKEIVKTNEKLGTFNDFYDERGGGSILKIDWILIKGFSATSIGINNATIRGQFPSDHFPVSADLNL